MKHNWEYKKINDLGIIKSGYTPSSDDLATNGDFPYFKVAEMNLPGNEKYLIHSPSYLSGEIKTFPANSIVFPKNGAAVSTNKKRILQVDSVVDLNTAVMLANQNISVNYLYYILINIDFANLVKRGAVPTLNISELKNIIVPVPPMETQEQIVAELDQINDLIAKNRELLSQLDALAQSLFYDTFGDPMTNPKGWGTQHFESCIHKIKYPSKKLLTTEYFSSGKYPIVSQEDSLISGYSDREDCVFHISNPVIVFGDHTRILKYVSFSFVLGADGVKILSPINTLSPRYFYYCLLLFKIPSLGYSRHYKLLKELEIPIPPLALQEDFAAKVEAIEAQKAKVEAEIAELQTLLDARMDYWFN